MIAILGDVEKLTQKLVSESYRARETAIVSLLSKEPAIVIPQVSELLLENVNPATQSACLDILEKLDATVSLEGIRTDGWFQSIGEETSNFAAISQIIGERFLAYAVILGVQIRTLTRDPNTPANTMVEFTVGDTLRQVLSIGEFRTRVVQALLKIYIEEPGPIQMPLTHEAAEKRIGQIVLLVCPLFDISVRRFVAYQKGNQSMGIVGYMSQGGFNFLDLKEFKSLIYQKVMRDLAGTHEEPFRLDLTLVEKARKSAEQGNNDDVIARLETWPGLLSTLVKTPIAAGLTLDQLHAIAEGLELLGDAYRANNRPTWSEELYRLGLQYLKGKELGASLYLKLGLLLVEQERYGESIGLLRRAIAMNEDKKLLLPALARAFLKRGKIVPSGILLNEAKSIGVRTDSLIKDYNEVKMILKERCLSWPPMVE